MSSILSFQSYLLDVGTTLAGVQSTFATLFTNNGWQIITNDTTNRILDVIPPSTETIGDSTTKEISRLVFSGTQISVTGYQYCYANGYPQTVVLTASGAGNSTNSITIGGVTVSQDAGTLAAGNTAAQNLRFLYNALVASANTNFTAWTYRYASAKPGFLDTSDHIIMTAKTASATPVTVTGNNTTVSVSAAGVASGTMASFPTLSTYTTTIDLNGGFIYYLNIFSRTFNLATKTSAGFFGPIFATYVDHAQAIANTPSGTFTSPIELFWGTMNQGRDVADNRFSLRATHCYGLSSWTGLNSKYYSDGHPFTGIVLAGQVHDFIVSEPAANWELVGSTLGLEPITNDYFSSQFPVVGTGLRQQGWTTYNTNTSYRWNGFMPAQVFPDLFRRMKATVNEGLTSAANVNQATTLASAMDAVSTYSTITLASTSGFAAQGSVVINDEAFTYTGISGNQLTGVSRGQFGSTQSVQLVGDQVCQLGWFMAMNDGQLYCGSVKPS